MGDCDGAVLKRNKEALHKCKKHLFNKFSSEIPHPFRHVVHGVCANCEGKMPVDKVEEYCRGYMAAGGNLIDVLPSLSFGDDNE